MNRLRDFFSDDNGQDLFTISSNNKEDLQKILDAVEEVQNSGKPKSIKPDNAFFRRKIGIDDAQYDIEDKEKLLAIHVYPDVSPVVIPISIDNKPDVYHFFKKQKGEKIEVHSMPDSIIDITLIIDVKSEKVDFVYRAQYDLTESLAELQHEYRRLLALTRTIFEKKDKSENEEQYRIVVVKIRRTIQLIQMIIDLSKAFSITVKPIDLESLENEEFSIEKAHLMIIQNRIIRTNDRLTSIDDAYVTDDEIGKSLAVSFLGVWHYNFFGTIVKIYIVNCVINAVIKSIEEDQDGKRKAMFEDSDSNPMYRAYTGYMNREKAENESRDLFNHIEMYANAKKIEEHLVGMLDESDD